MRLGHITVRYGNRRVLDDFSITLPDRGITALMAPSGAGKTTLLRVIAGLQRAPGADLAGLDGRRIAAVFQEDRLLPWLSAEENIAVMLDDDTPQKAARQWLERLGLDDAMAQRPGALSGGMKRRVALARALAVAPDILLLDEPFNGLDDDAVAGAAGAIRERMAGGLVILVTHHLDQARLLTGDLRYFTGPPLRSAEAPAEIDHIRRQLREEAEAAIKDVNAPANTSGAGDR